MATSRHAKDAERWNLEEATWFLAICAVLLELKVSRLTPKARGARRGGPARQVARPRRTRGRSSSPAFRKVALEIARRLEDEAGYFARDVGPGPEFSHLYPDPMTHCARAARDDGRGAAPATADPRSLPRDAGPVHGG